MLLPRFDFEAPASVSDVCQIIAQANSHACLMAGGTDLVVKMKRGIISPRVVISLGRVEALSTIGPGSHGLNLGACTTMSHIASNPAIVEFWPALAEGAACVGGPIIRNRATVGGNIVNARPCADSLPPLIALGAKITLQSSRGVRSIDLDGFVTAAGQCNILPDEILTCIDVPTPPANAGSHYIKITRRAAMEVTIVGCAASVVLDPDKKKVTQARLVFTSVAPVPLRIESAEKLLEGSAPTQQVLSAAAQQARSVAPAIGDHRAPQDYRTELVAVTTQRALKTAIHRAGGRIF